MQLQPQILCVKDGPTYRRLQRLPFSSGGKESTCSVGDLGLIPGLGRSPGEGKGYPLQYPGLENSMDYSPWGRKESDMVEQFLLCRAFTWPPGWVKALFLTFDLVYSSVC